MLKVTENAKNSLYHMFLGVRARHMGLRLTVDEAKRLGLVMDKQASTDQVFEYKGEKILLVGKDISPLLDGATLDTRRDNGGTVLTIVK